MVLPPNEERTSRNGNLPLCTLDEAQTSRANQRLLMDPNDLLPARGKSRRRWKTSKPRAYWIASKSKASSWT